jgi:dUTP pyrophosphatase
VWIESVDWAQVPDGVIPELQVRARSGLAIKHGIMLANGVGTVDADFPDEICALLYNAGDQPFTIRAGDRVAQLVFCHAHRTPGLDIKGRRSGGFGSTGG